MQKYCEKTQLQINLSKRETLSCVDLLPFKSVDQVEILSVKISAFDQRDKRKNLITEQIENERIFFLKKIVACKNSHALSLSPAQIVFGSTTLKCKFIYC